MCLIYELVWRHSFDLIPSDGTAEHIIRKYGTVHIKFSAKYAIVVYVNGSETKTD